MNPLALAELAISLGQLGWGLFDKPKVSPELQEAYDLLQKRAEHGLTSAEESQMYSTGAGQIARQATGMQARGSMALASRGMGRSSAADTMISSVNQTSAEMFGQLQDTIARLDTQIKQQATGQLANVGGAITQERNLQETARGGLIGGGLAGILGGIKGLSKPDIFGQLDEMQRFQVLNRETGEYEWDLPGLLMAFSQYMER